MLKFRRGDRKVSTVSPGADVAYEVASARLAEQRIASMTPDHRK